MLANCGILTRPLLRLFRCRLQDSGYALGAMERAQNRTAPTPSSPIAALLERYASSTFPFRTVIAMVGTVSSRRATGSKSKWRPRHQDEGRTSRHQLSPEPGYLPEFTRTGRIGRRWAGSQTPRTCGERQPAPTSRFCTFPPEGFEAVPLPRRPPFGPRWGSAVSQQGSVGASGRSRRWGRGRPRSCSRRRSRTRLTNDGTVDLGSCPRGGQSPRRDVLLSRHLTSGTQGPANPSAEVSPCGLHTTRGNGGQPTSDSPCASWTIHPNCLDAKEYQLFAVSRRASSLGSLSREPGALP